MSAVLAFGFPNPFDLLGGVFDGLLGAGAGVISDGIAAAVSWLVEAVLGALVDLAAAVLGFFWDAAEPETGAAWFSGGSASPYGQMVVLAAPLLAVFMLAGVIQGTLRGDSAGMLRMTLVRLPGAVMAMAMTIAGTDLLLRVSDELSRAVLGGFRDDVEATTRMLGTVALLSGPGGAAQFLMIVFGLLGLFAAVVLVIELFVRAALIYIVVALAPLIYAASVWEAMKGAVRKLAELGLALILSKFVISVALALSASAMVAAWGGNSSPTELVTPEAAAAASTSGGGLSDNVGVMVGAIVMFGVAAFMPFVLFRLMPMAEAALVAHGIKGGPVRAAQQASSAAMTARYNPASVAIAGHRARQSTRHGAAVSSHGTVTGGGSALAAVPTTRPGGPAAPHVPATTAAGPGNQANPGRAARGRAPASSSPGPASARPRAARPAPAVGGTGELANLPPLESPAIAQHRAQNLGDTAPRRPAVTGSDSHPSGDAER